MGWGAGMQKEVLPQTGGWSSTQVWSSVFAFWWHWGLAGRASEAMMVGGRCPNGAGQLARTHPDHTGGRGPPSELGRAKAWLSLGTSPAPGSAPPRPQPGHLISLALGPSTGPHLPPAPPSRLAAERGGAAGEIPRGCPSRAGPRASLAGLWSAGTAPLRTPKAGEGSGRCGLCSGPGASLWVCSPIRSMGTGEVPASGLS